MKTFTKRAIKEYKEKSLRIQQVTFQVQGKKFQQRNINFVYKSKFKEYELTAVDWATGDYNDQNAFLMTSIESLEKITPKTSKGVNNRSKTNPRVFCVNRIEELEVFKLALSCSIVRL